jgi:ABC-2 type transport system ATP-binding protein
VLGRFGDHRPAGTDCHVSIQLDGGEGEIAPVVRALDDAGLLVASLEVVRPTLDDVFLAKTGKHLEGAAAQAEATDEPEPLTEQAPV